jgi:hypothetical protein
MLLGEEGDAVIVIEQASHAWISGQLARAWGNERFAAPEPREESAWPPSDTTLGLPNRTAPVA